MVLIKSTLSSVSNPQKRSTATAIRAAMLARGWARRDLARVTGLTPRMVTDIVLGFKTHPRPRALIEHALGLAFWTDPIVFAASRDTRMRYGIDPRALTVPKLRALAAAHLPASRPYFVASSRQELLRCLGVAVADTQSRLSTADKPSSRHP